MPVAKGGVNGWITTDGRGRDFQTSFISLCDSLDADASSPLLVALLPCCLSPIALSFDVIIVNAIVMREVKRLNADITRVHRFFSRPIVSRFSSLTGCSGYRSILSRERITSGLAQFFFGMSF